VTAGEGRHGGTVLASGASVGLRRSDNPTTGAAEITPGVTARHATGRSRVEDTETRATTLLDRPSALAKPRWTMAGWWSSLYTVRVVTSEPPLPPPSSTDGPQQPVDSSELEQEVHPVADEQ
jgi:hypothetical protein